MIKVHSYTAIKVSILLVAFPFFSFAQIYTPYKADTSFNKLHFEEIKQQYEQDIAALNPKEVSLHNFYTDRYQRLIHELENEYFYSDQQLYTYFQYILRHILELNPSLKSQNIRLFISRSAAPNAYCMGEGTIVFNLQLLQHLDNESQIAFVLCHEIAHQSLDHVNNNIRKRIAYTESKKTKKQVKAIEKSKYNTNEQFLEMYRHVLYSNRRHDRTQEVEADALGLKYLKNTKYSIAEAIKCLEKLNSVDEVPERPPLNLEKLLGTAAYPFKQSWLEEENSIFNSHIEPTTIFEQDSIKTHPDCEERIQLLTPKLSTAGAIFLQPQNAFQQLKQQLIFEQAINQYILGNLGRGLYYFLHLLDTSPENAYVHAQIGQGLIDAYHAIKSHDFAQMVAQAHPKQEADYQQLLRALNRMRSSEFKRIAYHYLKARAVNFKTNEDYFLALFQATALMNKEEIKILQKEYQQLFPNGNYTDYINSYQY